MSGDKLVIPFTSPRDGLKSSDPDYGSTSVGGTVTDVLKQFVENMEGAQNSNWANELAAAKQQLSLLEAGKVNGIFAAHDSSRLTIEFKS